MNAEFLYTDLVAQATRDYGLVIEQKNSKWYWKFMNVLYTIITFGKGGDFMNRFISTGANKVGVGESWNTRSVEEKYIIMLHEVEHLKQFKSAGFGNVWLGWIVCSIGYLFLPFPIGIAYVRAKMEMDAYAQTIRAIIRVYDKETALDNREHIISQFTSWNYLFMWPYRGYMERWFDSTFERICREEAK